MPTKVRDWMSKPAVVIDPDTTVSYALTLMRRRNIHSVILNVDPAHNQYGIITSTDIRDKIIAQDRSPANTRAGEIMTAPLVSANPDWTLKECSIEMQKYQIHHMPVVDEQGSLIGLISATDIFMAAEEIGWHSS